MEHNVELSAIRGSSAISERDLADESVWCSPGGVSPFPFVYSPKSPGFIFPAGIYGIAPDFRWPYTYQLNFSVERQIVKDLSLTASYVGSLGHRLPFAIDLNYPYYNSTATFRQCE